MPPRARRRAAVSLALLASGTPSLATCGGDAKRPGEQRREEGQTEFESAPPVGQLDIITSANALSGGGAFPAAPPGSFDDSSSAAPSAGPTEPRVALARPEERDIYRVDGERLYFLNAYRGLMVFDITNLDDPQLLGRSPVYGRPFEMLVRNGIATIVVSNGFGSTADGSPFHGTVVRAIDARDPGAMKVEGEVQVKGSVRDTRVVGDKLFILGEDFGGQPGNTAARIGASRVVVSSVSFGERAPTLNATREIDASFGVLHVTSNAILVAHDVRADVPQWPSIPINYAGGVPGPTRRTGKSAIDYIAISPIDGSITPQGSFEVDGVLQRWIAGNGRLQIHLEDDTASILTTTCGAYGSCTGNDGYRLTTVDFSNPSAPEQLGTIDIAAPPGRREWIARFSGKRMVLAPSKSTYSTEGEHTSVEIYDLTNPAAPALAGSTKVPGEVWRFAPIDTNHAFVLGDENSDRFPSRRVALRLLDVSNPAQPRMLGTTTFGDDWPWKPASEDFKAITRDDGQKLVALPFSDWSSSSDEYPSGVQLIEYDTGALTTKGSTRAKGWVERGVFVKNRLVALSDQSLSVIDYTDRDRPRVVKELPLARNIVSAQADGATIVQLSTDWWGSDKPKSELRVLPVANAEENVLEPNAPAVAIDGANAQVFRNGDLAYVVTTLYPKPGSHTSSFTPRVQVVDLSNGKPTLKGALELPQDPDGLNMPRWGGHYYWDWYDTSNIVQVGGSALAFRRTRGSYDESGRREQDQNVYVVDLSDPDSPHVSSAVVTPDVETWWGNLKVVGNTLYATHYEYTAKPIENPDPSGPTYRNRVRYYLDRIDLTDRAHPTVGQRINVPGLLVGASDTDPSLLYFVDYRWDDDYATAQKNELAIARIVGDKAYLKSTTTLDGWVGNVFVRGTKAYMSALEYPRPTESGGAPTSSVKLLEVDLSDPTHPLARASAPKESWGWLVDVEGDRAILTSGWGDVGLDIYALRPGQAPTYMHTTRADAWWPNGIARHGGDLYLSTGRWGVQKIALP